MYLLLAVGGVGTIGSHAHAQVKPGKPIRPEPPRPPRDPARPRPPVGPRAVQSPRPLPPDPKPSILAGPETKTYPMPVPLTPPEEKTPGPFDLKRYETRSPHAPYSPDASERKGTLAGRIAAGVGKAWRHFWGLDKPYELKLESREHETQHGPEPSTMAYCRDHPIECGRWTKESTDTGDLKATDRRHE